MGVFSERPGRTSVGSRSHPSPQSCKWSLRAAALAGAALLTLAPAAAAQETINYTYDARGRLVKVARSGTVNNNISACYAYDKGDNRANVNVATSSACVEGGGGDPPPGGVSFSISSNASVTEGTNSVFTITKSGTATTSLTVGYATADGTAVAPGDYTAKSGSLTFTTAQTEKTVSVVTIDDTTVESPESFTMSLSGPTGGATIGTGMATATIDDNDSAGTCSGVSFAVENTSATEGGNLSFAVTKTGSTSSSCSVDYATANGTATAGSDYTAKSGTLTFTSTQTSKNVSVATIDDSAVENNETVKLNLSNATGGATISDSQGNGTVTDTDSGGGGNQPPVANFDNAGSMTCGDTMTLNVVANDTDPEGNYPLSLVSASGGFGILVSVASNTSVQILSTGSSSGTKSFSYVVKDSLNAQANGSGSVTVLAPCQ